MYADTYFCAPNHTTMDTTTVKGNIQRVRKDLRLTQAEMASKLGISRTAYRNFEKGETKVFSDHITKMATLSGKTEEELVLGYTPRNLADGELRELHNYREQIRDIRKEYENKLREKDMIIAAQETSISTLKEMVALVNK